MLDDQLKTHRLLESLRASLPFAVALAPSLARHLQGRNIAIGDGDRHMVVDVSYAGDEGGIVCHLAPTDGRDALVVSLTHLRIARSMALAVAITEYQKHRTKKLKKLGSRRS